MLVRALFVTSVAALLLLAGCGPAAGAERGACYGNGTCDDQLSCASGVCVRLVGGEGEGEAVAGEGEGEGDIVAEGEGDGLGEGEGDIVAEGEGEGSATCFVGDVVLPIDVTNPPATRANGERPNTGCVDSAPQTVPGPVVVVEGCVDVFGVGNSAERGVLVELFDGRDDPSTATPLTGGQVFIRDDAGGLTCDGADANEPACRAFDCDSRGFFRTTGTVATNIPLTFRVAASAGTNVIDTYDWGVVLRDTDAVSGIVNHDARSVFRSTWDSIPTLAGRQITGGQTLDGVGRALAFADVHDCDDIPVRGVAVTIDDFDPLTMTTAYFDGDLTNPNPDLTATATAVDGLAAIINVSTDVGNNTHRLVGGAKTNIGCSNGRCSCISYSVRTFIAFPDSVSFVTLSGDLPVVE